MLEKFSQQQLDSMSLEEVMKVKANAKAAKTDLEKQKKSNKDWNDEKQNELDECVEFLVDLDDYIEAREQREAAQREAEQKESSPEAPLTIPAGTEKCVHLMIVKGQRYDANTGKKLVKAMPQIFTFAEWQLFKKSFRNLGYTIEKVLHDPYGEAAQYVEKEESK